MVLTGTRMWVCTDWTNNFATVHDINLGTNECASAKYSKFNLIFIEKLLHAIFISYIDSFFREF